MAAWKSLASAFVIGGLFGLSGQVILTLYSGWLDPGSLLMIAGLLVSLGLIGAVLYALGIYQKLERFAGFGAFLPFSGLAAAVSGTIVDRRKQGMPLGQAIWMGIRMVIHVVGTGMLFSIAMGLAVFYLR